MACQQELDYYAVLNVERSATEAEITVAYRKLAVILVPNREEQHDRDFVPNYDEQQDTHLAPMSRPRQWDYINMAFDVLGNALLKAVYDRYGEAGLLTGVRLPNGYFPPYQYHGDNMRVYHRVFTSFSPYANLIDGIVEPPPLYSSKQHGVGVRTRDPPVEKFLELTLDEVRFGCVKIMNVMRQEFVDSSETQTEQRKKILTIHVPPGITAGTKFSFKEEGDRSETRIPADIVFVAVDKPHDMFQRQNQHDLLYTHKISLCQALVGFRFTVDTLDKRQIKVVITEVVRPGYKKIIPHEGLPKCEEKDAASMLLAKDKRDLRYGDLIIEFEIEFPQYVDAEMKKCCRDFFADLKDMEEIALKAENPIKDLIANKSKKPNSPSKPIKKIKPNK